MNSYFVELVNEEIKSLRTKLDDITIDELVNRSINYLSGRDTEMWDIDLNTERKSVYVILAHILIDNKHLYTNKMLVCKCEYVSRSLAAEHAVKFVSVDDAVNNYWTEEEVNLISNLIASGDATEDEFYSPNVYYYGMPDLDNPDLVSSDSQLAYVSCLEAFLYVYKSQGLSAFMALLKSDGSITDYLQ